MPAPTSETLRGAIVSLCEVLDGVPKWEFEQASRRVVDVLHGLTFYVHDTAKAALLLIDAGFAANAAALTRVALEHAGIAQWIALAPDAADQYVADLQAQWKAQGKVATDFGIKLPEDVLANLKRVDAAKRVKEIQRTETMFSAIDTTGQLYFQWRRLCLYVHPSVSTLSRYQTADADPTTAWAREQQGVDERAILWSMAMSVALATGPLVDLLAARPYSAQMNKIAEAAGLPTWATDDGLAPPGWGGYPNNPS